MSIDRQIIVTSTSKAIDKAKLIGKLDLNDVTLYNLINYYVEYTDGVAEFKDNNKTLKDLLFGFKYSHIDTICTYKTTVGATNELGVDPITNTKPVTIDITKDLLTTNSYTFTAADFSAAYSDADFDAAVSIRIQNLTTTDTLVYYDSVLIDGLFQTSIANVTKLSVTRVTPGSFTVESIFKFRISDGTDFSNESTVYIEATAIDVTDNQPATIGDSFILEDNRVTTVLTLEMFTSGLTPPYNDPEGDLIDAIRIDEISTANDGVYNFNGTPIVVNQIITREDLNAGLFVHIGADLSTVTSDVFNFSARDEGSLIWIE